MSKLFRFKVYWYNDQSNPDKGVDDGVVAAESYTTAAQHIEDYYGEEIIGFYLEEINNPLFVEEIKDWTDKCINSGIGFSSFDIQIQVDE